MTFELTDDAETYAQYPRKFAFRIHYSLCENRLDVTFEVENRDSAAMYFGLGGHPGFRVPLAEGLAFTDYRLRFSEPCQPKRIGFTAACFLDGTDSDFPLELDTVLPLSHNLFDDDAIVLKNMAGQVTLETGRDRHSVTVGFPGMDYLGIWHKPRTDAPYVCIEPWCSLPSTQDVITELETQPDLIALEPGNTYRTTWWIELHK
jgi:galactose mutarotase-like enzyme